MARERRRRRRRGGASGGAAGWTSPEKNLRRGESDALTFGGNPPSGLNKRNTQNFGVFVAPSGLIKATE